MICSKGERSRQFHRPKANSLLLLILVCVLTTVRSAFAQAQSPIEIEVACFRGGYGIDFYEKCAREFETLHPGTKINVWGSPRIWDQITPRYAAGTPPDICWPGFGMNVFSLIFDGHLLPLDKYLQQPAIGSSKPWGETFVPIMLQKGAYKDHIYTVPYNFDIFGWWYNKGMFAKHGWKPPRTYEALLTLCEAIKKERISPITFAGRNPQYMLDGFFFPWAYRGGGQKILTRVDNLEPGAWKDPAFLRAAQSYMDLKKRGYFQPGCIGMTHIESQMEFLVENAAMIPNGTWLYAEMKRHLPPGFEMEFMLCPVYTEGVGDPTATPASYEGKGWCISSKCKNPEIAAEYLRYITSADSARKFMATKGTMMSITGLGDDQVPDHLKEAMRIVQAAHANWTVKYAQWYPELGTVVQNAIRRLYNEVLTPEQFLTYIDDQATRMSKDPHFRRFTGQQAK